MIRTATPKDAPLLTRLHDRFRSDWPDFQSESSEGVETAITDDGMVYLLLEDRATVCLYADTRHAYGFLDFPYAASADAPPLIAAALTHLSGLRAECPLPAERVWEAEALKRYGFEPGRTQRRMVQRDLEAVQTPVLPASTELFQPTPDEVEALHDLAFIGHTKLPGWRSNPEIFPPIGLKLSGEFVGYALTSSHGGWHWLAELAIRPKARQQGSGRLLTLIALEQLREAGATEVHLYVNDDHDQQATRLYENTGFKTHRLTTRFVKLPS